MHRWGPRAQGPSTSPSRVVSPRGLVVAGVGVILETVALKKSIWSTVLVWVDRGAPVGQSSCYVSRIEVDADHCRIP